MTSVESFEVRLLATGGAASPAQVTRPWGGIQSLPVSELYIYTQVKPGRAV